MYRQEPEESVGALVTRLIETGKAYVQAEIELYKRIAVSRATAAGIGIGFVVAAVMLLQAALTGFVVAFGLAIARWLGPAGGMAVSSLAFLVIAAVLASAGVRRITSAGKDE